MDLWQFLVARLVLNALHLCETRCVFLSNIYCVCSGQADAGCASALWMCDCERWAAHPACQCTAIVVRGLGLDLRSVAEVAIMEMAGETARTRCVLSVDTSCVCSCHADVGHLG